MPRSIVLEPTVVRRLMTGLQDAAYSQRNHPRASSVIGEVNEWSRVFGELGVKISTLFEPGAEKRPIELGSPKRVTSDHISLWVIRYEQVRRAREALGPNPSWDERMPLQRRALVLRQTLLAAGQEGVIKEIEDRIAAARTAI